MDECRAENCKWKHPHKRLCPQGHDTFECGRSSDSGCKGCDAEHNRTRKRTPAYRALERERNRRRRKTPEYQEYERIRNSSPKRRAWMAHYRSRPGMASRANTLHALRAIRRRRGQMIEQIRELSALLVGQEATNG